MSLALIENERRAARQALEAAEAKMKAASGDARAFVAARESRQMALDTLERLDWRETAERERLAAEQQQAKVDALRDAQANARAAHEQTPKHAAHMQELATQLLMLVEELRRLQGAVAIGITHENFAMREGLMSRSTLEARLRLDGSAALTILQAGRELCMLCGMSRGYADQQASQMRIGR
jgi:hypothetical protein